MTTSRCVTAPLLSGTHTDYAAPWGLEGHLAPDSACSVFPHTSTIACFCSETSETAGLGKCERQEVGGGKGDRSGPY